MPSKLTAILAVGGLALITANEGAGLYTLVANDGVGVLVEAENQTALNTGLEKVFKDTIGNEKIRLASRKYAELYLDKSIIMERFKSDIF